MNLYSEQSLNGMVGETLSARELIARAAARIQKYFRRADPQQADRELKVRLDERRRERDRIARELHDTLFQGFQGASLLLEGAVEQTPADSPTRLSLNRALRVMHRVMDEGRVALEELRSAASPSLSLEDALYVLWDELTPKGVQFRIAVEGQPKALNPELQDQIYFIAREALVNALQHSGAAAIEAVVEYSPRRLRVLVRDNGCGIDPQVMRSGRDSHWGLLGMRERAGNVGAQLRLWSRPGAGTEVEISVPVHAVSNVSIQLSGAVA